MDIDQRRQGRLGDPFTTLHTKDLFNKLLVPAAVGPVVLGAGAAVWACTEKHIIAAIAQADLIHIDFIDKAPIRLKKKSV